MGLTRMLLHPPSSQLAAWSRAGRGTLGTERYPWPPQPSKHSPQNLHGTGERAAAPQASFCSTGTCPALHRGSHMPNSERPSVHTHAACSLLPVGSTGGTGVTALQTNPLLPNPCIPQLYWYFSHKIKTARNSCKFRSLCPFVLSLGQV